ncbi:MraY family glycosyltransferase [Leptothoe sp. LEGE 181152]|nr:MraY family glycosyltransferase [Leptothoe sp. LEGE 181152]
MPVSFFPIELIHIRYYILAAVTAFTVVLVVTPIVKTIALKHQRVDLPSDRKVHHQPMVRLGGIAICLGTLLALFIVWITGGVAQLPLSMLSGYWVVLLGSIGFFAIGLSDDLFNLSPLFRLGLQCVIASLVWMMGVRIDFLTLPGFGLVHLGWLSLPLTVFWLTGVVNAINWIDGLDGLASGIGIIAAATSFLICLYTGQLAAALIGIALVGSLLGFLLFNFNPAQIFMGDGGSYFIGFLLSSIGVTGLVKSATVTAILLPLLVLAVPLGDMTLVILARLRGGVSPFLADKRHLHHRLLNAGLPHRLTVLVMYALTWWASSLALLFVGIPSGPMLISSATGLLGLMGWKAWSIAQQG